MAKTQNYNAFQLIVENRPINYQHVENLKKQMQDNPNYLKSDPILCNSKEMSNDRYASADGHAIGIIDGQHRFLAAKAEGKTIYYTINDEISLRDVAVASAYSKKWTLNDYLHYYCVQGLTEYKKFAGYMSRTKFPPSVCQNILQGGRGKYFKTKFETGALECGASTNKAEKFADAVIGTDDKQGLTEFLTFARKAAFLNAFRVLYKNPKYDHSRMMAKVEYMSTTIRDCPDRAGFLKELSRVYNYNSRDKVKFFETEV